MNNLCWMLGHKLYSDTDNIAGTSTCKRCGYKNPAVVWPREDNKTTKYKKERSKCED